MQNLPIWHRRTARSSRVSVKVTSDCHCCGRLLIAIWRLFADLDLTESQTRRFTSLHACFTRELKPGLRPIDRDQLFQAKGCPYTLPELLVDLQLAEYYRDGQYATLRLTSGMDHRFHAPHDCLVDRVSYISGDTWNGSPIAILVASIRLHFLEFALTTRYRGSTENHCRAAFGKGQEMGWFAHGSTIIVLAPKGVALCGSVQEGAVMRVGRPLMRLPA
jgi:phosphatidylserine decarboxylase